MALPGVNTIIYDRFYTLSRTDLPVGPRVAAIAKRSTDEPSSSNDITIRSFDAYSATSEKTVIDEFGENSPLHRAYLELASSGTARITLVPLPSDTVFNHVTATLSSSSFSDIDVLEEAFGAAEAVAADIIVPWGRGSHTLEYENPATPSDDPDYGFYADNSTSPGSSWVTKIGQKCADITDRSYPCFAVLGVKPFVGTAESMTASEISSHLAFPNLVDRNDDAMTVGHYVSVVATEIRPLGYPTVLGYANGACQYAGTVSQLESWTATTGKPLYNVDKIRYNPTRTQQDSLTDLGLVPVSLDFNRVPRWIDGRTYAKDASDYSRLSTLRIVFDAVQLVRGIAQKFVGQGATLQNRNAFDAAISSGLRGLQIRGAVMASDYRVTYTPSENSATVDLVLTPAFELRNIVLSVSVNLT